MNRMLLPRWLALIVLALQTAGCVNFGAHQILRAPNISTSIPGPPVPLENFAKFLTNFPEHFVAVGPPAARLCYHVIEPADFRLNVTTSNWLEQGKVKFQFNFTATPPGPTTTQQVTPKGTVFLLHAYAMNQSSLVPWALRLAEDGWRCVLVDLRGHGRSGGKLIYYGLRETNDLSELMDQLAQDNSLARPVAAFGVSYGAALALRWATVEPRVHTVVAIAPYASMSNVVLNSCRKNSRWLPASLVRAGLRAVPACIGVSAAEMDTTTVLPRHPVAALFVASDADPIAPVAEVKKLHQLAAPGSELIIIPEATHGTLPYYFEDLTGPVVRWLDTNLKSPVPGG